MSDGYPNVLTPVCGYDRGSIEVEATGRGKVIYRLNGGTPQETGLFEDLLPGEYTITVSDDFCENVKLWSTTLSNTSKIEIEKLDITNSDCNENNGRVEVTANGNNLEYKLNDGEFQQSNTFEDLSSGNYTLTIKDSKNCEFFKSFSIAKGDISIENVNVKNSECGKNNGKISIKASSTGVVDYRLLGVTDWVSQNTFENLEAGTYALQVRNHNCIAEKKVKIEEAISHKIETKNSDCGNSNGALCVIIQSDETFEFILNKSTKNRTGVFGNLAEGRYELTIKSLENNCSITKRVVVNQNPLENDLSITKTDSKCIQNSGSISVKSKKKYAVYSLEVENKIISENYDGQFKNLPAGTYKVVASDENNCSLSKNVIIEEISDIEYNGVKTEDADCIGNTGSVTILAVNKLGGDLEYNVNNSGFVTKNYFENLDGGIQSLQIRNSVSGCIYKTTFEIPDKNNINIIEGPVATSSTTSCSNDGSIFIEATGSQPIEYSINGGPFRKNNYFTNLEPGEYTIVIKNGFGCTRTTGKIILGTNFSIDEVTTTNEECLKGNGAVKVNATGENLRYSLDDFQLTDSALPEFSNLAEGNYTIFVKNKDNCILQEDFVIKNNGAARLEEPQVTVMSCGSNLFNIQVNYIDFAGTYLFKVDNSEYSEKNVFNNLPPGSHTIFVKDQQYGCIDSLEIDIPEFSPFKIQSETFSSVCDQNNGEIHIVAGGGAGTLSLFVNGQKYDSRVVKNLSPGDYEIKLVDEFNCSFTASATVYNECAILFPNSFAPNENGNNEIFKPSNVRIEFHVKEFSIFNRYGNIIYQSKEFNSSDLSKWWSGTDSPEGAYIFNIVYELDNSLQKYSGKVTLIR